MSVQEPVQQSEERNWTMAVWLLYLGGHITVITVIAGLIIAYMKREQFAGTPYESHMTSAIRTFWIALIGGVIWNTFGFQYVFLMGTVIAAITFLTVRSMRLPETRPV